MGGEETLKGHDTPNLDTNRVKNNIINRSIIRKNYK